MIALSIILLLGVICYLRYCQHQTSSPNNSTFVNVTSGNIAEYAEAVGYIKPRNAIIVKSQIDGIVAGIYHYEGEYVKKGTVLLKVDPAPAPEIYAEAYQSVEDAKARETAAKHNLQQLEISIKQGLINEHYVDYIHAKESANTTTVLRQLAEQKLALLEKGQTVVAGKQIANVVSSPVDGYILSRNVSQGDPVISLSSAQAATPIFRIADMHDLMFEGQIDERDAGKIKIGMQAKVVVGSLPDQIITGTLSRIALQSEKENISAGAIESESPFNVGFKIEITNLQFPHNIILRSGYSATAHIKVGEVRNVLILPTRVLQFVGDQAYVLVVPASGKKVEKREVIIGLSDGINVEIKQGLKLGDKVLEHPKTKPTLEEGV